MDCIGSGNEPFINCDIETSLQIPEHKPQNSFGEYVTILVITLVIVYGVSKL